MPEAITVWFQFAASIALIGFAGSSLSRNGDVIADKTGFGGTWVGIVLLSTVTSFPELVTGISAVSLADAPDIAVGTILGSCVFNMVVLVILDYLHRQQSLYETAGQAHILSASFGILLVAVVGFSTILSQENGALMGGFGFVGVYTPIILLIYGISVRVVFLHEQTLMTSGAVERPQDNHTMTLLEASVRYGLAAAVVVGTGIWLPFVGEQLAKTMGWHETFVGTLFIAVVTSVPEMVVTVAALRIGAIDMAVANLFGSNMFNILVIAVDDLFYTKGPILSHVSPLHMLSAFSAIMMTGVAIIGLLYRPKGRIFGIVGWASLLLVTIYLMNSYVLFLFDG